MGDNSGAVRESYPGDVYCYFGPITRAGYHQISTVLEAQSSYKDKCCLVLATYGGDPDAGYRIARALRNYYKKHIDILIPGMCKSAGTLICLGANRLVFGDRGELGPLDVQLSKPDEVFESMSGLDIVQSVSSLNSRALQSYFEFLFELRGQLGISTRLASEASIKLVGQILSPIAAKLDPVTLGQHQRAIMIALEYGERLIEDSKISTQKQLSRLISTLPSHGFVIDRKDAKKYFNNVDHPNEETIDLYLQARSFLDNHDLSTGPTVFKLIEEGKADESTNE